MELPEKVLGGGEGEHLQGLIIAVDKPQLCQAASQHRWCGGLTAAGG